MKRVKCSANCSAIFLFSQPKQLNLMPRFSRLTVHQPGSVLHFWRHRLINREILPNLVNSIWFWWIMRVLLANQKRRNISNESWDGLIVPIHPCVNRAKMLFSYIVVPYEGWNRTEFRTQTSRLSPDFIPKQKFLFSDSRLSNMGLTETLKNAGALQTYGQDWIRFDQNEKKISFIKHLL